MVDRAIVISLLRRSDRLAEFVTQPALRLDWVLPEIEVFEASDGRLREMNGMQACRESHMRAWVDALSDGVERLWVFEDDAVLDVEFPWRLRGLQAAVPDDWEALWLGGVHLRPPEPATHGVVRCIETVQTHAYCMTRGAMHAMLVRVGDDKTGWFDHTLAQWLGRRGRTYAPDPMLVTQSGSPSDCGH